MAARWAVATLVTVDRAKISVITSVETADRVTQLAVTTFATTFVTGEERMLGVGLQVYVCECLRLLIRPWECGGTIFVFNGIHSRTLSCQTST